MTSESSRSKGFSCGPSALENGMTYPGPRDPIAGVVQISRQAVTLASPEIRDAIMAWVTTSAKMRHPPTCGGCNAVFDLSGNGKGECPNVFGVVTVIPVDALGDIAVELCRDCAARPDAALLPIVERLTQYVYPDIRFVARASVDLHGGTA